MNRHAPRSSLWPQLRVIVGLRECVCDVVVEENDTRVECPSSFTYSVTAPDPFGAPYHSFLLDRTPKPEPEEPLAWHKDEYPD